jgi:hypothetical protein
LSTPSASRCALLLPFFLFLFSAFFSLFFMFLSCFCVDYLHLCTLDSPNTSFL